ncbi:amidase [Novosphingobium sp. ERN07]|uniref:amidase n=1 Tax=Novosphingobium sp. ERN07 TaxID=2726187 RepID=UPI0014568D45|nr:amidase [Novosphingobium sp. ERN07]NLR70433.1 amidase [Novosphingobium sp. ERN07]
MNQQPHKQHDRFGALSEACDLGDGPSRVVVKDCIDVAGMQTVQGSAVLRDAAPAPRNAATVAGILSDPRWRIIGKARMHEFAFGVTGINPACGTPVNPGWPTRIPGGSSSGSAVAVAGGLADVAIGTDTGGSVRMPAACCGVIGFKPTYGLVDRTGASPAVSSLDCIGVFARDVAMVEAMMQAIAPGFVPQAEPSIQLGILQVQAEEAVAAPVRKALDTLGGGVQITLPSLQDAFVAGMTIIGRESWNALKAHVDHPAMGEDVRLRVRAGGAVTDAQLAEAEAVRLRFAAEVDAALDRCDVLALPTLPVVPPLLADAGDAPALVPLTRLVRPFNLSGHPAISLPLRAGHGLPVSLQLVGRRGEDAQLCAAARNVVQRLEAAGLFAVASGLDREN